MSTSRATVVFGRAFRYTPIRTGSDLRSQGALQKISHLLQIPILLFHMGGVPAILEIFVLGTHPTDYILLSPWDC